MKLRSLFLITLIVMGFVVLPSKARADDPTYLGPIQTESGADWDGQWEQYIYDTCGSDYAIDQYELSVDGAYEQNAYHWSCSTSLNESDVYASYILYTDSEWVYE